jgi:hypothetical protein
MRTMIALLFSTAIGFTATTATAAGGAPGHVTKPTQKSSSAALYGAGHMAAGSLGNKFGASSKPVAQEQSKRMKR